MMMLRRVPQTFLLTGDGDGEDLTTFTISSVADSFSCLQPQLERLPHFDGVAFEQVLHHTAAHSTHASPPHISVRNT